MIEIRKSIPRGMLFLYDHNGKDIVIPDYDPQQTVVASSNAISIATISDMDGEVDIKLCASEEFFSSEMFKLFSNILNVDAGTLSICFMGDKKIASINTTSGSSLVEIYANKRRFPSSVVITVADGIGNECNERNVGIEEEDSRIPKGSGNRRKM